MVAISIKAIKYFPIIIVAIVAVLAGWWLWSYYIQFPWTRGGKIRAEKVSITPQMSGRIVELDIKDNQLVSMEDLLFTIDKTLFQVVELNAQVQLAKAQSDLVKANNEANRHRYLSQNSISTEELDIANLSVKTTQASVSVARATLKQTQWQPTRTGIRALVGGWVTNLTTHIGDYADVGKPLFTLVDSHSFCVTGYFGETKLRHIHESAPTQITLYSDNKTLRGHISGIGRTTYDQNVESDSSLIPDVKPNVPWVRLAQRVPIRFALGKVPDDAALVSGTTRSIAVGQ